MSSRTSADVQHYSNVTAASIVCRLCGILILVLVVASAALLTVPRMMGYDIYHVVSGSMEPEIPVGSVVYVEPTAPESINVGDIIAFHSEGSVIVHRVVNNQVVEGKFTTKGDANEDEDMNDVEYAKVVGRVVKHVPKLGQLLMIYSSNMGKVFVLCFAACGVLLNVLAGRFRPQ